MTMADIAALCADLRSSDWYIKREPEGEEYRIYLVKDEVAAPMDLSD